MALPKSCFPRANIHCHGYNMKNKSGRTVFWEWVSVLEKECFLLNVVETQGTELLWVSDGYDPGQKTVSVYNLQAVCELLQCA